MTNEELPIVELCFPDDGEILVTYSQRNIPVSDYFKDRYGTPRLALSWGGFRKVCRHVTPSMNFLFRITDDDGIVYEGIGSCSLMSTDNIVHVMHIDML